MWRMCVPLALIAIVVAGCGAADRPERAARQGLPRALAREWEARATSVAGAASAGRDCLARQLAASLRADVESSKYKVPRRLRSPLLTGVTALADLTTCRPVTTNPAPPVKHTEPKPKPRPEPKRGPEPKPPKPPKPHGPPGGDKGHGKGHEK